jgi:hypothetical protein
VTLKPFNQRSLRAVGDAAYTRLERAAMDALAHELRQEVPDLAEQFGASRPNIRRNTGFGLATEMMTRRPGRTPAGQATGDLGSVHAMVADLPHPIAFRARVRDGLLLALIGDSYGQDTRGIDFGAARFDQVFTIDASGRSVPAVRTLSLDPVSEVPRGPTQQVLSSKPEAVRRQPLEDRPQRLPPPRLEAPDPSAADPVVSDGTLRTALRLGVAALGLMAVLLFDFSPFLVLLIGIWALRTLESPKRLPMVRRLVEPHLRAAQSA